MKKTILLALTMLFALQGFAFSDTFFWEDKKGIHMIDDASKLPPKFRDNELRVYGVRSEASRRIKSS